MNHLFKNSVGTSPGKEMVYFILINWDKNRNIK